MANNLSGVFLWKHLDFLNSYVAMFSYFLGVYYMHIRLQITYLRASNGFAYPGALRNLEGPYNITEKTNNGWMTENISCLVRIRLLLQWVLWYFLQSFVMMNNFPSSSKRMLVLQPLCLSPGFTNKIMMKLNRVVCMYHSDIACSQIACCHMVVALECNNFFFQAFI